MLEKMKAGLMEELSENAGQTAGLDHLVCCILLI